MAVLTAQPVTASGLVATMAGATVTTGDTFQVDDRSWVEITNGSGSSINAVFTSYHAAGEGFAAADKTVAVAAGATKKILLDPTSFVDPSTNLAKCICSAVTSVTIGVFRRP